MSPCPSSSVYVACKGKGLSDLGHGPKKEAYCNNHWWIQCLISWCYTDISPWCRVRISAESDKKLYLNSARGSPRTFRWQHLKTHLHHFLLEYHTTTTLYRLWQLNVTWLCFSIRKDDVFISHLKQCIQRIAIAWITTKICRDSQQYNDRFNKLQFRHLVCHQLLWKTLLYAVIVVNCNSKFNMPPITVKHIIICLYKLHLRRVSCHPPVLSCHTTWWTLTNCLLANPSPLVRNAM